MNEFWSLIENGVKYGGAKYERRVTTSIVSGDRGLSVSKY